MQILRLILLATLSCASAAAWAQTPEHLSPAEEAKIFKAAGFVRKGGTWQSGCGDPGTASYMPGAIEIKGDLNGDGFPEAVVTEGSSYCYGMTGTAFWLVSKQEGGVWKLMYNATGMPEFLETKSVGGWPEISVGGPGFCFPVMRWIGTVFVLNRYAYEGKPCRP